MPNYYPAVTITRRWRGNKPKRRAPPDLTRDGEDELFVVVDSMEPISNTPTTFMQIEDHWDNIFQRLSAQDQISLCCVSKKVRDAAAKQLYRKFHIFFPDDDETDTESESDEPYIDALAGGLNTFATSSYNYAQYIQEIVLETQLGGLKGERAYLDYHYDLSCGKFMNTLLHLTLLKAVALQTFRWDVRVELSPEVFKTLHETKTLKHLHLRMHDGPSMTRTASAASSIVSTIPSSPVPTVTVVPFIPSTTVPPGIVMGGVSKWPSKHSKTPKERPTRMAPPTISGFKNLTSLAILDLDTVEYVEEIKHCLDSSSLDLRCLKLSFSDQLAGRARKPPPEPQPDEDSDLEDEFGQIQLIPPPGPPPGMPPQGASDPNAPIREMKAQEEKTRQDLFLAKLFGREKEETEAKKRAEQQEKETSQKADDATELFSWLRNLVNNTGFGVARQETLFRSMEKALEFYGKHSKELETQEASKGSESAIASTSDAPENVIGAADDAEPSLFKDTEDTKILKPNVDVSNPDDINIEEPEEEVLTSDALGSDTVDDAVSENGEDPKKLSGKVKHPVASQLPDLQVPPAEKQDIGHGESSKTVETKVQHATHKEADVKDYIRSTRGLCLETLAICLIPVHGIALTKSIDLTVLIDITLLSVGQQGYFWILLAEENIRSPLPLKKIHTDEVSWSLLSMVNQLQQVDELLLLQRSINKKGVSRIENTNGQTNVKIKDIRRLILKKHASTLKVLMIRNNNPGTSWDLDMDTIILLCSRAKKLQELAVSFGTRVMHTLLQSMSNLASLRALHIIRFHCHDNNITRELRKFAVENVAKNPDMKLEYFALDSLVERIVRKDLEPEQVDIKGKGKEKVAKKHKNEGKVVILSNGAWTVGNPAQVYPMGTPHHLAPTVPAGLDWGSDSEDEEESPSRSKIDTIGDMRFSNITDVRIFEKEVMIGRL